SLGVDRTSLSHRRRPHRPGTRVAAYDAAGVVVHTEKVERLLDEREIRLRPLRPRTAEDVLELRRVAPQEYRVEVLAVHVRVGSLGGGEIFREARGRMFGLEIHHQADLMSALTAISLERRSMSAQQLVGGDGRLEQVPVAGRQYPVQVAAVCHYPGLIQRRPQLDPVVEL